MEKVNDRELCVLITKPQKVGSYNNDKAPYQDILLCSGVELSAVVHNELHVLLKVLNGGVITTVDFGLHIA